MTYTFIKYQNVFQFKFFFSLGGGGGGGGGDVALSIAKIFVLFVHLFIQETLFYFCHLEYSSYGQLENSNVLSNEKNHNIILC